MIGSENLGLFGIVAGWLIQKALADDWVLKSVVLEPGPVIYKPTTTEEGSPPSAPEILRTSFILACTQANANPVEGGERQEVISTEEMPEAVRDAVAALWIRLAEITITP